MMGERDRLRALQMRIAGHDGVEMAMGERDQRAAQFPRRARSPRPVRRADRAADRARPDRCASARYAACRPRRADLLGQAALDREMDILVGKRRSGSGRNRSRARSRASPATILRGLGAPQQAEFAQHPRMRDRTADVMAIEPAIERQRGGEGFDLGQARRAQSGRESGRRKHRRERAPFWRRRRRMVF